MTDQSRSGLTSDEGFAALEALALHDAVAFLLLNVEHEGDTAMTSFLQWCEAHSAEIRAAAAAPAQHLDLA